MTWIDLILLVVFGASILCLHSEGMWGNALRLINVVTAALLAVNLFEPLADWIEGQNETFETFTYVWDFLTLWGLFGFFMVIFRLMTDNLSKVKMRFLQVADRIGGIAFAVLVSWVLVCFFAMSLHTAPLARNFMDEAFKTETDEKMLQGTAPDRRWLGFVQRMSFTTFGWSTTEIGENEDDAFDPGGGFMLTYASRRASLESHVNTSGELRVNP